MDRFWKYKLDHVAFWGATVGFHMYTKASLIASAGLGHFFLETLIRNGLLAVVIYVHLLILVPKFAQRKKFVLYFCLLGTLLIGYVLLKNAHDVYLYGYVLGDPEQQYGLRNTYYNFSIVSFYLGFSVALHLSKEWYFQREQMRSLTLANLNAELEYLKAQVNPHFVFNSINTVYFQIDRQNELARKSLSDFSELLRYQLYECNGQVIPIEKEINYIKSYIALQRMRKDENYSISFESAENVSGFSISPLLLIPFIENAFKHVSHFAYKNVIRISLTGRGNLFCLSVFNTKEDRQVNGVHAGIGLRNVKRRLELLYGDRYELTINDRPATFEVVLTLRVDEHTNTINIS